MSEPRNLSTIAREIRRSWRDKNGNSKVYFGAVPYLDAMAELDTTDPRAMYFEDTAKSVVIYFLSNATTWRGEDAKRIKAELKALMGIK